jgi:hypothetical protein
MIIPFPLVLSPLEVEHKSKNELDRIIESFHNTHMRLKKIPFFLETPTTM